MKCAKCKKIIKDYKKGDIKICLNCNLEMASEINKKLSHEMFINIKK